MIEKGQLEDSVNAAGSFIGLLQQAAGSYSVNTDFFKDPSEVLKTCGDRMNNLVDLLYAVLAKNNVLPPSQNPPVFDTATWLMIQNPVTGGTSPLYVVLPAQDASGNAPLTGQIGLGALLPATFSGRSFEVYVYLPLFNYSNSTGSCFLLGTDAASFQIGLNFSNTEGFTYTNTPAAPVTFSGINIATNIYFSAKVPEFLLSFTDLKGTALPASYTTLASLLDPNVEAWLDVILQDPYIVLWLNKNILEVVLDDASIVVTVASLLAAAGIIKSSNPTDLLDPEAVFSLTINTLPKDPVQIAFNFLLGMLNALNNQVFVNLPGGGIFISARQSPKDNTVIEYGLGLRMQMPLNNGSGEKSSKPSVEICLGAWLTGEDDSNNWMKRSGAPQGLTDGLIVWFISNKKTGGVNDISFSPGFSLSSVGINITGGAEKPLFSIGGYTLKGAELRATLDAEILLEPSTWQFGFAAKLDEIGFPLVPSAAGGGGGGSNPVAKSLIQAGDMGSNGGSGSEIAMAEGVTNDPPPGDNAPANPTFGMAASWYYEGNFNLQLFDTKDNPSNQVMIPINRQLGPLNCEQIGVGWVNSTHIFSILFDGSVMLGPLTVSLDGLAVGVPITDPTNLSEYSLDLQGMGIEFNAGAVSLTGAFVKIPPAGAADFTEYAGIIAIKAGVFAISALGAYAYIPATAPTTGGFASLFIFSVLDFPIGGPEFFFITGVAIGFGYNRAINLPDINGVTDFPFVAMLNDPTKFGPTNDVTGILKQIDSYVPPQRGEYWLAAGVRFTSFDLIQSVALLSVEFGNELEIGILGTSWMALPPPPSDWQFAYVELAIDIQILPDKGVFSVTAILTPNSFVIAPDCHLTGGFAFFVWFGNNPHAGQFVLTVGGYHPRFQPPSYYPQVPRLGFNWNISSVVTISGDSYFALTSSAIMAGGGLALIFHAGPVKAWFIAQMDALVQWAPFQYDLDISISIGVQLKLDLGLFTITITIELGAALEIWGPNMGGKARISVFIISFTIYFGADPPAADLTINWDEFKTKLLPAKQAATNNNLKDAALVNGDGSGTQTPAILTIAIAKGLLSIYDDTVWIVRPASFSFSAQTALPTTALTVSPATGETIPPWPASYSEVNIRPLAAKLSSSIMNVELINVDDGTVYSLFKNFDLQVKTTSMPAAKWGPPIPQQPNGMAGKPEMNSLLYGQLMGFVSITPKTTTLTPNGANALSIDATIAFDDIVVDAGNEQFLPLNSSEASTGTIPVAEGEQSWNTIQSALQNATVGTYRTSVFNTLVAQFGINPFTNDSLAGSDFAKEPGAYLNGYPMIITTTN